jgi:SAM-dependent methyltransferase
MKKYIDIVQHYENCLKVHGDNHLGVDWPNEEDVLKRFNVMLDLIYFKKDKSPYTLLDFGCGAAHLYQYIIDNNYDEISYEGLDLSSEFIALCRKKYKNINFHCFDILNHDNKLNEFDYIVLNGVFTEKRGLTFDEMYDYFQKVIIEINAIAKKGFAFNVMSKNVDWERDDLFHLSLDLLSDFLCKKISRNFIIRNDYGLYEYTVYVYKA